MKPNTGVVELMCDRGCDDATVLDRFLRQMFEGGVITLPAAASEEDGAVAADVLKEAEAHHRLSLPGEPPLWDPAVGGWAARILLDACRALVHREVEASEVTRLLTEAPPGPWTPSTHYSVDVLFRALPDVLRLARGISHDDPLTLLLLDLARSWPLSSVGVPQLGRLDVSGFIEDRSLRRTYAQRIVQHNDIDRLEDERVRREVQDLLGAYPSLSPAVTRRIEQFAAQGRTETGRGITTND